MKKILGPLCVFLFIIVISQTLYIWYPKLNLLNPLSKYVLVPKPLLVYTFDNLHKINFPVSNITLGPVISDHADYFSQVFYYDVLVRPGIDKQEKVSGLMNIPKKPGTSRPVIVMFRGFVPDNMYAPGVGTQPVASALAEHGFITLAPDFLGYGTSASPSADPFENRFQTYTTAASLLSSLPTLPAALSVYSSTVSADMTKIGIWAHSNGGHIALSTLAITNLSYPTVLWAPVSTSFPYDILYYTDEYDDQGKALRKTLFGFEELYNTDLFSPPKYYSWIKAPLEIDQGTNDHEVPVWWSDDLESVLKKDGLDITYQTYPGADHNLLPSGWSAAVLNDIDFYTKQFAK